MQTNPANITPEEGRATAKDFRPPSCVGDQRGSHKILVRPVTRDTLSRLSANPNVHPRSHGPAWSFSKTSDSACQTMMVEAVEACGPRRLCTTQVLAAEGQSLGTTHPCTNSQAFSQPPSASKFRVACDSHLATDC